MAHARGGTLVEFTSATKPNPNSFPTEAEPDPAPDPDPAPNFLLLPG